MLQPQVLVKKAVGWPQMNDLKIEKLVNCETSNKDVKMTAVSKYSLNRDK